jgi:hypothetical protein
MCRILIGGIHLVYIEYTEINYLPFVLFKKEIAQTSCQLDSELYFSNKIQLKFFERKNAEKDNK